MTNPFCLRASTRQAGVLTVATTLPACAGHWGSACTPSCQFDGALGTRWVPPSTHFAQACHSVREMYRRAPPPATLPCFSSDTLHLSRFGGTCSLKFTGDISGQRPRRSSCGSPRSAPAEMLPPVFEELANVPSTSPAFVIAAQLFSGHLIVKVNVFPDL